MKRRTFILSLVGGSTLGWTGWKNDFFGSSPRASQPSLVKITRSTRALGTDISLTVFHREYEQAEAAIQSAFQELERVEDLMSIYRAESQLSQLNRDGFLKHPHPYLLEILEVAEKVSRDTQGAFDISIQPLYELFAHWGEAGPDQEAIQRSLKPVDWKAISVCPERIHLKNKGAALTLNGIAQGFASDKIVQRLRSEGVEHALIDSGEIGTLGRHAEDRAWSVGIKHPRREGKLLGLTKLDDRCLATSGDYETKFGKGYELHHLLDPRTGNPANELSSVSIAAPSATMADALSTAVFVSGIQQGKQLIQKLPNTDALFVSKSGHLTKTRNFPFLT